MYYLTKIIRKFFYILPNRVCIFFGKIIGLYFYFNINKRRIAFRNIKLAFPKKNNKDILSILRKSFMNFGISIIETFIIKRVFKYVRLKDISNLEGSILTGIHEGSWELYNATLASNFKYAIFVKEQPNKKLYRILEEIRRESNIISCSSFKEFIRYLKNNYTVGLSFDHGADEDSLYVDFFGHLVPTPVGAVFLAKKYNKKIYPGFGYRTSNFCHTIEFSSPIEPDLDYKDMMFKLNKIYEGYIRKHPTEYFWLYKRFKRKKDLEIVVISDGKRGHIRQSEAFLAYLAEENQNLRVNTIEVKFKKFGRIISDFCGFFSSKNCIGCGLCLKFILKKETLEELEKLYADIVISTGSFCASLNRIFSFVLGAKSISILKPNIPLSKFDLVILPEHDRISSFNVVKIKGALFNPSSFEKKASICKDFFRLDNSEKISLFLGGPLYDEDAFFENLKIFIESLKDFSIKNNYKLLVSTSRRTPKIIEEYIEKSLFNFMNKEAIVYANRENYDFVFEGFVYFSKYVFISSESISMISEVLSLKRQCICVSLEKLFGKHSLFLNSIKEEVNILEKPYNIKEIPEKTSNLFEENKMIIKSAIKRIL